MSRPGSVQVHQVDCVKLAVDKILHRKPDLCLSGINHGANHSINVFIPELCPQQLKRQSKAFHRLAFLFLIINIEADFSGSRKYVRIIVQKLLQKKQDKHMVLNVNIPALPDELIRGIKVCRQAYAKYEEDFIERNDPNGRRYYWLTGEFVNFDKGKDTDVWALANQYVSIVPVQFDLTNYVLKAKLEKLWPQ
jgi:5'-nucleotidase